MNNLNFYGVLKDFVSNPSESNMLTLINFAKNGSMSNHDIVRLAQELANSSTTLRSYGNGPVADIPSTGGPASLSTLLCPLFLKNLGCIIPKLGVPGRPAGAIDVLAQIKGYNINPDPNLIKKWLSETGYAHFIAGNKYARLDAQLFSYRKKIGAISVYPLVIASILSKKIAVGLTYTGLDIRVSDFGNFGNTWNQAEKNALNFIRAASILGIKAKCFLTNGAIPYQPYIGRGEALLAIRKIYEEELDNQLQNHCDDCYSMSATVAEKSVSFPINYKNIINNFRQNIETQGGSFDAFIKITNRINENHVYEVRATHPGFIKIDLQTLRNVLVECQNKKTSLNEPYPDPCGLIIKKGVGDFVDRNEIICTYRCENMFYDYLKVSLKKAITISSNKEVPYKFQVVS